MAVLLTKPTAARLLSLLGERPPSPLSTLPADGGARRPSAVRSFDPPFSVRYSADAGSWLIYIPARAAVIPSDSIAACATVLAAADGLDDWYTLDAAAGGPVYLWLEAAAGSEESQWWQAWGTAKLNAGLAAPQVAQDSGLCVCVATIDAAKYQVKQHVVGQLVMFPTLPDDLSLELAKTESGLFSQIKGWDKDGGTEFGITAILSADPDTGEITAENGDKYEILVRVGGKGGLVGMMPFGRGTGVTDPSPDAPDDPCSDHPGGTDGVDLHADAEENFNGPNGGGGEAGVPLDGANNGGVQPCNGTTC